MLSADTINAIKYETTAYWVAQFALPEIVALATGKEIGHKLADVVDEKTTALLTVKHLIRHQYDRKGGKRSRSMGDMWLDDGGIYHPINVKIGVAGREGRPNLASLKKVLDAVMARQIDSYYLLYVKLFIEPAGIRPGVHLVDMLDWLDYVAFDSGPGQMMLKAQEFFAQVELLRPAARTVREKVDRLMGLYEDGENRLRVNREQDLSRYRQMYEAFRTGPDGPVTPLTQQSLGLA